MSNQFDYDVIIAGGGPAGASAAIHLATSGARVLLTEQKKFPRQKLCGEFISPECALHFEKLGVIDRLMTAGPASLKETVFYARGGKNVIVPSSWFGTEGAALGLSRAEMDERLLRRASEAGAHVIEESQIVDLMFEAQRVVGVKVRGLEDAVYRAPITIDATGRSRALTRRVEQQTEPQHRRPPLVAFKAHLENTNVAPGACEIYFYRGGYGGLSQIENGLSNLCFIAAARDVRRCGADAERVMREIVSQNHRAAVTLANAKARSPWLAVSLEGFGRHSLAPADGLLAIGDAASFIDPFTGSGMLMALEGGEIAANVIGRRLDQIRAGSDLVALGKEYESAYRQAFASRLRLCSFIRRAAFAPGLAEVAIRLFSVSNRLRRRVARATRGGLPVQLESIAANDGRAANP